MKHLLLFVTLLFSFLLITNFILWGQNQEADKKAQQEDFDPAKVEFETYYIVFLKKGPNREETDEKKTMEIQQAHLNHLKWLGEEGYTLAAGPFEVPPEEDLRGIVIYPGEMDKAEVERLATDDPAVKAGRLRVEVLKWWTPAGNIHWPKKGSASK